MKVEVQKNYRKYQKLKLKNKNKVWTFGYSVKFWVGPFGS